MIKVTKDFTVAIDGDMGRFIISDRLSSPKRTTFLEAKDDVVTHLSKSWRHGLLSSRSNPG